MVKAYFRGAAAFAAMLAVMGGSVEAAPCGNNSAGFENWKQVFAREAAARKFHQAQSNFCIDDHNLLDRHHPGRPGPEELQAVARRLHGKARRPGDRLARHDRSSTATPHCSPISSSATAFRPGRCSPSGAWRPASATSPAMQNTLSAVATLAYDCRRPEYFTDISMPH